MKKVIVAAGLLVFPSVFLPPADAVAAGCMPATFAGAFANEITLCQNWTAAQQQEFWFLPQGSQIIPYDWFLVLEQAGGTAPFRDPIYLDGFRYLPQQPTALNPDGLPVGFTRDEAGANRAYAAIAPRWLGLNCSACHTGQVEFGGRRMLVDGAPAMADFQGFVEALAAAMRATLADDAKFARFAAALGSRGAAREKLRSDLAMLTATRTAWNDRNRGGSPYGFARLDAIGAIFNEVTATALGNPANARPADAPVSYPFIWDTPQHDVVQWNGSVRNEGPGALGRNVGEVLGVFGHLKLDVAPPTTTLQRGHESSVRIENLGRLEALLWKLQSPEWPSPILPAIDQSKDPTGKGRAAFVAHCGACHADIRRDDADRRITAIMTPLSELGTDDAMARNFAQRVAQSGPLQGLFKTYLPLPSRPERFGAEAAGVEFLRYAVAGVIARGVVDPNVSTIDAINAGKGLDDRIRERARSVDALSKRVADRLRIRGTHLEAPVELSYKARPLNGIWATAPYLHNGSVRTLRQLLGPASARQASFRVGSREYDPVDLGFVDAGGSVLDTSLPGNSRQGHEGPEYGTDVLAADPALLEALLEYLKTL